MYIHTQLAIIPEITIMITSCVPKQYQDCVQNYQHNQHQRLGVGIILSDQQVKPGGVQRCAYVVLCIQHDFGKKERNSVMQNL